MLRVRNPVRRVTRRQRSILDHQQVLRVFLFRRFREIKTARQNPVAVDDHDFVVRDRVFVIDQRRHAGVHEKIGRTIFLRTLALIQHHRHFHAPPMRIHHRLRDRRRRKRIRLHQNIRPRQPQFPHHRPRRIIPRRKINLRRPRKSIRRHSKPNRHQKKFPHPPPVPPASKISDHKIPRACAQSPNLLSWNMLRFRWIESSLLIALLAGLAGCDSNQPARPMRNGITPSSRYTPPAPARPLQGQTAPPPVGDPAWQSEATKWIGTPYRTGGMSRKGMDCSGLVGMMYQNVARLKLPRTTDELSRTGTSISQKNQLRPGDIVLFQTSSRPAINHAGIFLGGNRFVHASTAHGVMYSELTDPFYAEHYRGARRILR